jgi:hypothetical protein
MSIRRYIEDAKFLWKDGRRESAMLLAVVAVAATARKEQPTAKDGEAFKALAKRIRPYPLLIYYRGEMRSIEEILYKWVRCVLVHEADWPMDIRFIPNPAPGQSSVRAAGGSEDVLELSESWFEDIIHVVVRSPANVDEFKDM